MKLGLEKRGERSLFTAKMMNEFIWQSKMSKCNSRHCQSTNRAGGVFGDASVRSEKELEMNNNNQQVEDVV